MYGASFPSEVGATGAAAALASARVVGGVAARFRWQGAATVVAELAERGGYRLALPTTFAAHAEAAQINTGGGVAGGDCVATEVDVGGGADVVFATQGAERIYRSTGAASELCVVLKLAASARLDWLPQQTIAFAGARLRRRIDVEMAADSRLLMTEILTYGRPASREGADPTRIEDQWRIRRGGRLVFAEALRMTGDMPRLLDRPAIGGGARTSALVLLVAPDAEDRLEHARLALSDTRCECGVSAWHGLLCARLLAVRPADAIAAVSRLAQALSGRAMPRVWSI